MDEREKYFHRIQNADFMAEGNILWSLFHTIHQKEYSFCEIESTGSNQVESNWNVAPGQMQISCRSRSELIDFQLLVLAKRSLDKQSESNRKTIEINFTFTIKLDKSLAMWTFVSFINRIAAQKGREKKSIYAHA